MTVGKLGKSSVPDSSVQTAHPRIFAGLPADRAALARALFLLVAAAERDEDLCTAEADSAAAPTMAAVLGAFDGAGVAKEGA